MNDDFDNQEFYSWDIIKFDDPFIFGFDKSS
jgi:hypothetical protein